MALSEWTVYKSEVNARASIDYTAPISGGGSLVLSDNGVAGNPQTVLLRPSSTEKGLVFGKIRTVMRLDTVSGAGAGFVFMLDQENITRTDGNFYGLFVGQTRMAGTTEIVLSKFYDGLQSAPNTLLFYTAFNPIGVFALEVEWESDLGSVGGTHIIVRRSNPAVDTVLFDNLSVIYDQVETLNPLVITRAEGIAYHNVFGGTNKFTLDKSSLIRGV